MNLNRLNAPAAAFSATSRAWAAIDAPTLTIGTPTDDAVIEGAFEHRGGLTRGSGGASVSVGPGTVWLQLALPLSEHPAEKIINRYVRPLLRAIGASYFGRDWIAAKHRPVGAVGFAHSVSGACLFEAVMAVTTPFATERESFRGKVPAVIGGDCDAVIERVISAYGASGSGTGTGTGTGTGETVEWIERRSEAMGVVLVGRDASGRVRVGGELMASREAVIAIENGEELPLGSFVYGARVETLRELVQNIA